MGDDALMHTGATKMLWDKHKKDCHMLVEGRRVVCMGKTLTDIEKNWDIFILKESNKRYMQ